jgi:hypothetical protein
MRAFGYGFERTIAYVTGSPTSRLIPLPRLKKPAPDCRRLNTNWRCVAGDQSCVGAAFQRSTIAAHRSRSAALVLALACSHAR